MKTRNKILTLASLGISGAAVAAGALVTSSAMAATATPDKADVAVVAVSFDGKDAIRCEYDDIQLPPVPPGDAGTHIVGTAEEGVVTTSGGGELPGAPTLSKGGVVAVIDAKPVDPSQIPGVPGDATLVEGKLPEGTVVISSDDAREGTPQECAALRPPNVPAP